MSQSITYHGRQYIVESVDLIDGTNEGFAWARNSRNQEVILTVTVQDGKVVRAATKHERWENVH